VWAVVGLAAALDGHHERTPTASVIVGGDRHTGTHTAGVRGRVSAPSARPVGPATRSPRAQARRQHGGAPRRRPAPAPARAAAARPEGSGVQAPAPPQPAPPAPPAPASAPRPPAAEQTQGGLFSP
jgi:hypothetical protein